MRRACARRGQSSCAEAKHKGDAFSRSARNREGARPRRPRTLTAAGLRPSTSRRADLPRGALALRADAFAERPCSFGLALRAFRGAGPYRPRPSSQRMLCNQSTCWFSLHDCLTIPAMGGDKRAQATRASRGSSRPTGRHRRLRARILSWNQAVCRRASSRALICAGAGHQGGHQRWAGVSRRSRGTTRHARGDVARRACGPSGLRPQRECRRAGRDLHPQSAGGLGRPCYSAGESGERAPAGEDAVRLALKKRADAPCSGHAIPELSGRG